MATIERSNAAADLIIGNVRTFLQIKSAYDQCDDNIKKVIDEMLEVFSSEDATGDEKESACITIVEALFPALAVDMLEQCELVRKSEGTRLRAMEMAEEERIFADRVQSRMAALEMTQGTLAEKIGIGQPAVSNMLNRKCRPQKRTVQKIAAALEIDPEELWPGFNPLGDAPSTD
jgi:lambda repressor-like predicted transcriptional regulator